MKKIRHHLAALKSIAATNTVASLAAPLLLQFSLALDIKG
jgi:hypothetical protein